MFKPLVTYLFNFILVFFIALTPVKPLFSSEQEFNDLLEMDIEELITISIASKREESIENAPGVISIITSDEIKLFGAQNLRDILNRQTNMLVVGSHLFPDNQVSLRAALSAIEDNQVLYLLNGRPFTNTLGGGVHMDIYFNFPIDIIDQIEIIRGPGSVLYGTNAFTGIINIKTKQERKSALLVA